MTREEFMLQRLKDDATTNRRTYPILLGCVVVFAALCVAAFFTKGPSVGVGSTLIMISIALRLPIMKQQIEASDDAIAELEAHIADPSVPLSESTEDAISVSNYPARELLKGWIAIAVVAVVLVVAGIFFLTFVEQEGKLFLLLAIGTILMGIFVSFPAIRMYRSWKVAKDLEAAGL